MNGKPRWTPGPWIAGWNNDACVVWGIANVLGENKAANANLIAAAPDLYDALAECVKWLEESAEGERATQLALAAIKKARGENVY